MTLDVVLENVEFVGLRTQLDPPARFSWGEANMRNVGLVKATLSDGTVGWGETSVTFPLWTLEERAATITMGIGPLAVGKKSGSIDQIRKLIANIDLATARLRSLWSPVGISSAIAALEMALLDALGVREGVPVWKMFDGKKVSIPMYGVGFSGTPAISSQQALLALHEGFQSIKVRLGFGLENDIELMTTYRDVLGSDVEILADVNMGWDLSTTKEMLPVLESFGIGWLEEPIARMDLEGLKEIHSSTSIPIAAGENCYSESEALELIDSGAVDIYMPDLARGGGFLAALNAKNEATSVGLGYSPHHYASDIGFAAMITLCSVTNPAKNVLRDLSPWPLRESILEVPLHLEKGMAFTSEETGMGPRPNMDVLTGSRVL